MEEKRHGSARWFAVCACAGLAAALAVGFVVASNDARPLEQAQAVPSSTNTAATLNREAMVTLDREARVTFNRDVAPIVYKQCSSCHHAGEAAPFSLVSYRDFKKRAQQVMQVVESRYMPPWMPEDGVVKFEGERRLSVDEIAVIRRWVEQGAIEGDDRDRPTPPVFTDGWRLGTPDLVVKMPQAFVMPAEGKDIYRNFVVPVALSEGKWVRGIAIRPGGRSVVHHGFLSLDVTGKSAELRDDAEAGVGYGGMDPGSGVGSPAGQFVSWQPGKQDVMGPQGSPWWMPRRSDLVLQLHMRPSGKEERVQGEVGLYFTDEPADTQPSILMLRSVAIDIPAGAKDYGVESSYVLPVAIEVTSVLPHAHFLGRRLAAWATLPNGERRWLLKINDWNFDWQGDYRYSEPVKLPRGTQISMRYQYDNSEENARNPNHPPKRVMYGLDSSDEMGELWLQVVTRNAAERRTLEQDYQRQYAIPDAIAVARAVLQREPTNVKEMVTLGVTLLVADEVDEAVKAFNEALAIEPEDAKARYHLGVAYTRKNDLGLAVRQWKEAVRIDANYYRAHNSLAGWYLEQQNLPKAEEHLLAAVDGNENHMGSRLNLAKLYAAKGAWARAEAELRIALEIEPHNEAVRGMWKAAREKVVEKRQ